MMDYKLEYYECYNAIVRFNGSYYVFYHVGRCIVDVYLSRVPCTIR